MDDGSTDKLNNSIEDIKEETKEDILEESNAGLLKQKSTSNASLSASDEIDAFLQQDNTTCTSVADNIENIEKTEKPDDNAKESISVLDMAIGKH